MPRATDALARCLRCAFVLEPGAEHDETGGTYFVPVCTHPAVANRMGVLALRLARATGSACAPEARLFKP